MSERTLDKNNDRNREKGEKQQGGERNDNRANEHPLHHVWTIWEHLHIYKVIKFNNIII